MELKQNFIIKAVYIYILVSVTLAISSMRTQRITDEAMTSHLHLRTSGRSIVNKDGIRLKLRCVSWSGAQEKWFAPNGLHKQHVNKLAVLTQRAGFNCVRLVWSLEMALGSTSGSSLVPDQAVAANPGLLGKTPLEVFDAVIAALAAQGLMVILDNHTSDAIWCCSISDGNGLWYTEKWTELDWLQGWSVMAQRYANTSAVIGVGLRNEPRPVMFPGVDLRFPTWGFGGPKVDLAVAYEKAAAAVLATRRTYLIFAQGTWFGSDLRSVRYRPLVLRTEWPNGPVVHNQLVYEAHEYAMGWPPQFDLSNYEAYSSRLDDAFGYLVLYNVAPVWIGEFGTRHSKNGTVNSVWWRAVTRYIKDRDLDWGYWSLDGQEGPSRDFGEEEPYGVLNQNWDDFANPVLIEELQRLM